MAKEIKKRLNRDFLSTDSNQRILEAYHSVIDQENEKRKKLDEAKKKSLNEDVKGKSKVFKSEKEAKDYLHKKRRTLGGKKTGVAKNPDGKGYIAYIEGYGNIMEDKKELNEAATKYLDIHQGDDHKSTLAYKDGEPASAWAMGVIPHNKPLLFDRKDVPKIIKLLKMKDSPLVK